MIKVAKQVKSSKSLETERVVFNKSKTYCTNIIFKKLQHFF
jgi:hypothetical protein